MSEKSIAGFGHDSHCEDQQDDSRFSKNASALRNQLAGLPMNNALEFLANVRKIAREIDLEANAVSEELASIEESYPKLLTTLRRYKEDLLVLRDEICSLRSRYDNYVSSFIGFVQEHYPSLIPQLQSLSRKQMLLTRMKWENCGRELLSNCRRQMKESKHDWLRLSEQFQNACEHAVKTDQFPDNTLMTFNDDMSSLAVDLKEFSGKCLKEILRNMNYPFEDSLDLRAFENEITDISGILSLQYLVAEHIQKGSGDDEICRLLLSPFEIRFAFHFYGDRKTNDIRKPQWYLSQILNWIQVNLTFFVKVLDNVSKIHNLSISSACVFLKFVSELPIAKTRTLLKQERVLDDILLFSNLVDECISYEAQLRGIDPFRYSSNILSLFCEEDVLDRWIEIENDCCLDRMDAILSAPDGWESRFRGMEDADQFLVCNCADAFVSIIQSQQSRAKLLPESLAQRRFIDLQLLLTDDFRKRLAHIARQSESPWSEPFPNVMNAVWYLKHVVEEWSDNCLLSGITLTGKRAVFDESSSMFRHVWNQMAEDISRSLKLQTIDMIRPYQQLLWCAMEPQLVPSREITSLFCPILMKIRTIFASTGEHISKASLDELFKRMSSTLATVFTEEVVSVTPFSTEGANQMLFDVENGLIPVLSHIFVRCGVSSNLYYDEAFTTLLGSLKLLSLSRAVITLLKDEIDQVPDEIAEEKLFEMKVYGVNKDRARNLIRLRSDIEAA